MKLKYSLKEGREVIAVNKDKNFLYLKYKDEEEWVKIPIKGVKEISVIDDIGRTLRKISVDDFYKTHLKTT